MIKHLLIVYYIQLDVEFQRTEENLQSEQCNEIEENNRMRKTRDFFKKVGEIKGWFHARMGTIKDRNSKDLREAEEIKRRHEYTEEPYKKGLNDPDNHVLSLT